MSDVRIPLWLKFSLFGTIVALVPVIIVGLGLININVSTLKTQSREFRLAIAEDIGGSLDEAIARAHQSTLNVGQVLTDNTLSDDQRIELALALVQGEALIDRVGIYDAEGGYIATIRQGNTTQEEALSAELQKVATREPFALSKAVRTDEGDVRVNMVTAMRVDGKVTGFLASSLSLARIQRRVELVAGARLAGEPDHDGPRSALYVLDDQGQVLAHSVPEKRMVPVKLDGLLGQDIQTLINAQVAYSGESSDGVTLVSAKPLGNIPWVSVVEIPLAEAYASVARMRVLVAMVAALAALFSVILALFVARRLTRPLEKLVVFTKTLAERKFKERVDVQTSDEIGVLADGMNRTAKELEESEAKIAHEIEIRADLGRYLPKELVENIVARQQDMELGGVRKEITVLFADVVRFTPLCENMEPEQVVAILNELFTILTEIVFKHGGTIDKFLGDCVMAFWGAPTPCEDHAIKALEAAEEMQSWLEVGNERWKKAYGITIELAIGVNTGPAIIGNIGSKTRMEYTAIGSAVNIAARLESLARPRQILTTRATKDAAEDLFDFGQTSTELLSQGGEKVDVYEVIS